MIRGSVNQDLEAVIVIDVEDINGAAHSLEVVLDTGFTGLLGSSTKHHQGTRSEVQRPQNCHPG